jgi:hypothetical protein
MAPETLSARALTSLIVGYRASCCRASARIVAEQAMRVAGVAIARQAGIENDDLAAGTAELQGGGEAGKAAADDDDVIHGDGHRVVDGGGGLGRVTVNCWTIESTNVREL